MGSGISTKYEKTEGLKVIEKAKEKNNKLSEVKNSMPCYKHAYTDPKKFYEYSLDETNINGVDNRNIRSMLSIKGEKTI